MNENSPGVAVGSVDLFGPGAAFDHVGVAVQKIDPQRFPLEKIHDKTQDVRAVFADVHGTKFELIEPASDKSPITASIKKGIKVVHLCFTVPDIDAAIAFAVEHGFFLVAAPVPAIAFNNRKIAWLVHDVLGLFELLER